MIWFRLVIVSVLWNAGVGITMSQEPAAPLPEIWIDIQQEAETMAKQRAHGVPIDDDVYWEAAKRIVLRHNRSSIDVLFKTMDEVNTLPFDQRGAMRALSKFVVAEIADPEGSRGFKPLLREWGWSTAVGHTAPLLAMSYYDDDAAREWLLELALTGEKPYINFGHYKIPGEPYLALHMLRGFEPTSAMRERLQQALRADSQVIEHPENAITHDDAIRAVLSSWDYASSLEDAADRARCRKFQSRMWRFYAIGPSVKTRRVRMPHGISAQLLLEGWQQGDERFVLHIFEEPASTPDEAQIGVHLAHKLPDSVLPKLEAIAESDSPQAPFARQALQQIERRREQSEE